MAVRQEDLENTYQSYRQSAAQEDLLNLVQAGERLVRHFTRIYTGGLAEDALQSGREGLLKAIRRFDPDKQVAFATYASHCIMGEIRHYLRKEASYYRPGSIKDLQNRVDRYVEQVIKERGEPPELEEIAEALNVKVEGVVQAMRAGLVSLDEVDIKKIQSLRYESFKLPIEDKLLLQQALARLTDLQRKVIYYLFFLDLTQTQTGKKLGLSQRAVSRVLHKSLQKMAEVFKL
ncbi:MAG: sigma-70 family RNA polymerase sigma factor [Dethiobacteraceae bacterium]|jgi:RNA polymerase sigma-B factor|nr:sigma-70 family RNA polymerase sigma factor [Bacillota bacterium]